MPSTFTLVEGGPPSFDSSSEVKELLRSEGVVVDVVNGVEGIWFGFILAVLVNVYCFIKNGETAQVSI